MKKWKFDQLSPEVQTEYLERGGRIDPRSSCSPEMLWNYQTRYGRQGKPKGAVPSKSSKSKKNRKKRINKYKQRRKKRTIS